MAKLQGELDGSRSAVREIEMAVLQKDAVISQLRTAHEEMKNKLAAVESAAKPGSADAEEVSALKETIERECGADHCRI
jgi:hypothetical protein